MRYPAAQEARTTDRNGGSIPLSSALIGYAGYARSCTGPGDRRRFLAYAKQRGLSFRHPALDDDCELVVVTQSADLPGWTARKRKAGNKLHLVLDLVDAYFQESRLAPRLLMGIGRYYERRDSRLSPDFLETLRRACSVADGILCSTLEQREIILRYNDNVEVSFDWFGDELCPPKREYGRGRRLKLVWEGQAVTLRNVQELREPLNTLKDEVELHVVTDETVPRWLRRYGRHPSRDLLNGIECPIILSRWDKADFSRRIIDADVAIIPMDLDHPIIRAKPENKLVLFWKLGMPVLVAPTPAYRRAMGAAGLDMLCETPADWLAHLRSLAAAPPERLSELGRLGYEHATLAYDDAAFRRPYDRVLTKLGFALS